MIKESQSVYMLLKKNDVIYVLYLGTYIWKKETGRTEFFHRFFFFF